MKNLSTARPWSGGNAGGRPEATPHGPDGSDAASAGDYWHFLTAFLRRPLTIGAVAPSSTALARAMIPPVELGAAQVVVELGAGTGAITSLIRRRIGPQTLLLAMEVHAGAAARLRLRFPDLCVINDDAENLRRHLDRSGRRHADCIICGLPFGNMSDRQQDRIFEVVLASLKPGGTFSAMAYLHAAPYPSSRRFKSKLARCFSHIEKSPVVWANLPPSFAYYCR